MFSLDAFHAAYDAEAVEMTIGGRAFRIFIPRTCERFWPDAVTPQEFPLWARVWPASLVLAELLASMPVDYRREMIEIGGGLGHVSLVAAACGHRITFSEANPHALAFARASAHLNGLPQLPVVHLNWDRPAAPKAFDTVIGSELFYRDADIEPLQRLFTLLLKPGGEVILAGEVRRSTDGLMRRMAESFPGPGLPEKPALRAAGHPHPCFPHDRLIAAVYHENNVSGRLRPNERFRSRLKLAANGAYPRARIRL